MKKRLGATKKSPMYLHEVPKAKGINLEGTFLEVANTPKTSDVCLIRIALRNSPRRKRNRKRAAMGNPWVEVQLKFSASMVRIEMDPRKVISGPLLIRWR